MWRIVGSPLGGPNPEGKGIWVGQSEEWAAIQLNRGLWQPHRRLPEGPSELSQTEAGSSLKPTNHSLNKAHIHLERQHKHGKGCSLLPGGGALLSH